MSKGRDLSPEVRRLLERLWEVSHNWDEDAIEDWEALDMLTTMGFWAKAILEAAAPSYDFPREP